MGLNSNGLHIHVYIYVTFAAVLHVSLNAEEYDNQPRLRKYFRAWQSRPYRDTNQGQRSESKAIIEY